MVRMGPADGGGGSYGGRAYEGLGTDPELVASLASAYLRGLQAAPHGVLGCPKHLAADGAALFGTGKRQTVLDQGDARRISPSPLSPLSASSACPRLLTTR
jgi:beta-glucosidase-like glycosyl hydrolase